VFRCCDVLVLGYTEVRRVSMRAAEVILSCDSLLRYLVLGYTEVRRVGMRAAEVILSCDSLLRCFGFRLHRGALS
jgi:hypothetical protein